MLAAGDPIRDADGLLELTAEVVPGALQRAIDTARDAVAGSRGMGVPARRRNGQPLTMQVMPLEHRHGANTPASVAPAVAQLNAEALSALAYTQVVRKGCPAIYGHYLSTVSMKSGAPMAGTPEISLMNYMIGQMARFYNVVSD